MWIIFVFYYCIKLIKKLFCYLLSFYILFWYCSNHLTWNIELGCRIRWNRKQPLLINLFSKAGIVWKRTFSSSFSYQLIKKCKLCKCNVLRLLSNFTQLYPWRYWCVKQLKYPYRFFLVTISSVAWNCGQNCFIQGTQRLVMRPVVFETGWYVASAV